MDRREWFGLLGAGTGVSLGGLAVKAEDHEHTHMHDPNSMGPVHEIHAHFCGIHIAKNNPKFQLVAQHYCMSRSDEMHQCLLYDSTAKNAKLLGVEYIISDRLYRELPEGEKKYWHPHTYEVLAGGLIAPGMKPADELAFMKALLTTWGKTWHTWPDPKHSHPARRAPAHVVDRPGRAWSTRTWSPRATNNSASLRQRSANSAAVRSDSKYPRSLTRSRSMTRAASGPTRAKTSPRRASSRLLTRKNCLIPRPPVPREPSADSGFQLEPAGLTPSLVPATPIVVRPFTLRAEPPGCSRPPDHGPSGLAEMTRFASGFPRASRGPAGFPRRLRNDLVSACHSASRRAPQRD